MDLLVADPCFYLQALSAVDMFDFFSDRPNKSLVEHFAEAVAGISVRKQPVPSSIH